MLYIIGLGLNEKSISLEGIEAIEKCEKIYLESYTVEFPYSFEELEKRIGKKIININRELVESDKLIKEAKKENIALLVYGSPLTATTHITLIQEAKKQKVKYKIIYNASVLDGVAECGLQLYKFGKIASMPKWQKNFTPDSFMEIVKDNQKINAHSLILIDIGLELKEAKKQLEESAKKHNVKLDKMVVCSGLGTGKSKIIYKKVGDLEKQSIAKPYCIIIPSKLHFMEEEVLENS